MSLNVILILATEGSKGAVFLIYLGVLSVIIFFIYKKGKSKFSEYKKALGTRVGSDSLEQTRGSRQSVGQSSAAGTDDTSTQIDGSGGFGDPTTAGSNSSADTQTDNSGGSSRSTVSEASAFSGGSPDRSGVADSTTSGSSDSTNGQVSADEVWSAGDQSAITQIDSSGVEDNWEPRSNLGDSGEDRCFECGNELADVLYVRDCPYCGCILSNAGSNTRN